MLVPFSLRPSFVLCRGARWLVSPHVWLHSFRSVVVRLRHGLSALFPLGCDCIFSWQLAQLVACVALALVFSFACTLTVPSLASFARFSFASLFSPARFRCLLHCVLSLRCLFCLLEILVLLQFAFVLVFVRFCYFVWFLRVLPFRCLPLDRFVSFFARSMFA